MKQTINHYEFAQAFRDMDRHNFSREGLHVLYEYFEEIDSDYELDVIAVCCEYCEATPIEIADMYSIELSGDTDTDYEIVNDFLSDHGVLVGFISSGCFLFQNF
jgi:hypothetical protein